MNISAPMKTAALATAFTIASLSVASAATTIVANGNYIDVGGVVNAPNGTFKYDYVAGGNLMVDEFALSAIANNASDIESIQASFVPTTGESVMLELDRGGNGAFGGGALLSGLTLAAGDAFSILFEVVGSIKNNVGVQVSFSTSDIAPVPVPAAGALLLTALGAAGFVSRRRKKLA